MNGMKAWTVHHGISKHIMTEGPNFVMNWDISMVVRILQDCRNPQSQRTNYKTIANVVESHFEKQVVISIALTPRFCGKGAFSLVKKQLLCRRFLIIQKAPVR